MRALVTGGTGFVGSNLVRRLDSMGWEVLYTGQEGENTVPGTHVGYHFDAVPWSDLGPVDVVFHQAAITDTLVTDWDEMMQTNLVQSIRLCSNAAYAGVRTFVYASSCATYGDVPPPFREYCQARPLNVYGQSKLLLDEVIRPVAEGVDGLSVVGLRYSNVYGPGENHKGHMASMVFQLARQIRRGERPRLFEFGEQRRDFVYVDDVVDANLLAAHLGSSGVYNCGSGIARSFTDLLAILQKELGTAAEVEYVKNPKAVAYQSFTECDMSLAKARLGHEPRVSLEEGIRRYVRDAGL